MIGYKNASQCALQRYWYSVHAIKLYAIIWYVGKADATLSVLYIYYK